MKKTMTLLMLLITVGTLSAQQNPIDRFYEKYQEDTSFTSIEFSGKMFEMVNHIEPENAEEEEMLENFKMIEGVSILLSEKFPNGKAEFQKAVKVPGADFENLVTIDDDEGIAEVLIKEKNGVVTEVLVVAGGDEGFALVGIWGEISLNKMASIMREIQVDMMKDFDGEAVQAGQDVSMFPNPVSSGNLTVNTPTELEGGFVRVHDMNGKLVLEKKITTSQVQLNTDRLNAGTYAVTVMKGNNRVYAEQLIVQ